MSNPTICTNDTANQVYGFLCQKTNVFYAFESYETYKEFLEWLEQENAANDDASIRMEEERHYCEPNPA